MGYELVFVVVKVVKCRRHVKRGAGIMAVVVKEVASWVRLWCKSRFWEVDQTT